MRSIIPTLLICAAAVTALGAHHADALRAPAIPVATVSQHEVYSSPEAARHRSAQPRHWGSMVLMPRAR